LDLGSGSAGSPPLGDLSGFVDGGFESGELVGWVRGERAGPEGAGEVVSPFDQLPVGGSADLHVMVGGGWFDSGSGELADQNLDAAFDEGLAVVVCTAA
jgi:hypothetical protein